MMYIYLFIYLLIGYILYTLIQNSPLFNEELYKLQQEKHPDTSIEAMHVIACILLLLFWPILLILAVKKL